MTVRNRALTREEVKLKIKRTGIECEGHREVAEQKCGNESQLIAGNLEASRSCCRGKGDVLTYRSRVLPMFLTVSFLPSPDISAAIPSLSG